MKEGDTAIIIGDQQELKRFGLGKYHGCTVTLLRPYNKESVRAWSNQDGWRCKIQHPDADGGYEYYVPIGYLAHVKSSTGFKEGDTVRFTNLAELTKVCLGGYLGYNGIIISPMSEKDRRDLLSGKPGWWVRVQDHSAKRYYVPESCLTHVPNPLQQSTSPSYSTTLAGEPNKNTNQKEKQDMYVYKVRFVSKPNELAQQAGEKEQIVATVNDIMAGGEHEAVAKAAAQSADAIKAVEDSKGDLRVTVKVD